MKTIKLFLTTIAALLCSITANAEDFSVNGIYYNVTSTTDLTVGVTFKGASVSYYSDEYIGAVTIPETVTYSNKQYRVTSIGNDAFQGCYNLTSVSIPKSVISIGGSAFFNCRSLTSVNIPEGVEMLEQGVFGNCHSLVSITIPEGVISIGSFAFSNCSNLASITIPEGVTKIESIAFDGCSNLTSITIPESVAEIGHSAFYECYKLTAVHISSIEAWCKIAFEDDDSNPLFYGGNLYLNENLVANLCIPESVTSIRNYAFSGCGSLTSISIPESVTEIGEGAFYECNSLTAVHISSIKAWCEISFQDVYSNPLYYGGNLYLNENLVTNLSIPVSMTSIGNYTFSGCSSLTSIAIPASVTEIGGSAFRGCSGLTSIIIPENVTLIGNSAFSGCGSLTSITISEGVTSIGNSAFYNCSSLVSIVIPKNVTLIEDGTFWGCSSLTSIAIPASVTEIGGSAFRGCSSLTSITIPASVTEIGGSAFCGCIGLTSIVIPKNVTLIEDDTFWGCSSLTSITIPANVTEIGETAFGNCSSLTSITCKATIPPAVDDDDDVFYYVNKKIPVYVNATSVSAYQAAEGWREFTNIQAIAKEVNILDASEILVQNKNEECASVTYTRDFTNTAWQSLYVPFEIPVTEELLADFEVADLNDIRQYDRDDDGVKDETVVEAFKVKSGATLAANYPYLIRAKEVGEKTITVTDATLYATEEISIDCSSIREKFTFTGTYSRMESDELAGCYALCDGVWQPLAADATLGAFRVYLQIESRDSNIAPARAIRMHVVGEDGTTDIDELESNTNNQQPAVVYDLQGRRITNVDNLKGVYIVNGKKVVK